MTNEKSLNACFGCNSVQMKETNHQAAVRLRKQVNAGSYGHQRPCLSLWPMMGSVWDRWVRCRLAESRYSFPSDFPKLLHFLYEIWMLFIMSLYTLFIPLNKSTTLANVNLAISSNAAAFFNLPRLAVRYTVHTWTPLILLSFSSKPRQQQKRRTLGFTGTSIKWAPWAAKHRAQQQEGGVNYRKLQRS